MTNTNLKDKLESAKIRYFADPIHYEGRHFANRTAIILKSDYDFFKPYIRKWSDKSSKQWAEIKEIEELQRNKLRLFDGNYSIIVPDNLINNKKKLDAFFKTQDFLAGPQVDYESGKYLDMDGDDSMTLDLFGNKVESADYKFFSQNHLWIEGSKHYTRTLYFRNEDEVYLNVQIFNRKTKAFILSSFEGYGYNSDVQNLFDGGELNVEDGIIFVNDLDDNEEIQDAIMEWHNEYLFGHEGSWKYDEQRRFGIKYKNPIVLTSDD